MIKGLAVLVDWRSHHPTIPALLFLSNQPYHAASCRAMKNKSVQVMGGFGLCLGTYIIIAIAGKLNSVSASA